MFSIERCRLFCKLTPLHILLYAYVCHNDNMAQTAHQVGQLKPDTHLSQGNGAQVSLIKE